MNSKAYEKSEREQWGKLQWTSEEKDLNYKESRQGIPGDENNISYGRDRNEYGVMNSNNLFNKH